MEKGKRREQRHEKVTGRRDGEEEDGGSEIEDKESERGVTRKVASCDEVLLRGRGIVRECKGSGDKAMRRFPAPEKGGRTLQSSKKKYKQSIKKEPRFKRGKKFFYHLLRVANRETKTMF